MLFALKLSLVLSLLGVWMAANPLDALAAEATRMSAIDGISITADNQILVELMPEDTTPANLFDLNGRTLVFTPDGQGGYSRSVQSVAWENDIGRTVADGEEIRLQSFLFDFAGRRWGSFFVSRRGLITFGERLTYRHHGIAENRDGTMREIAAKFVTTPTISPLYKPYLGGWVGDETGDQFGATQHVAGYADRVVVTWITTEPVKYVHGVPPAEPSRFQVVLHADGSITFNYNDDVFFGDGIVGLFPYEEPTKGDLIASILDATDTALPGHLDLLEVAIYEANTGGVIVEWTTRDPLPLPSSGTRYSYRLTLDVDEPYFDGRDEDDDFVWQVNLESDTSHTRGGRRFPTDSDNRVALLVENPDVFGISASMRVGAHQFDNDRWVTGESLRPVLLELPDGAVAMADLSRSDSGFSKRQSEVFHHRSAPDFAEIACRVINILGDEFDFFVFHFEFRVDNQEHGARNFFFFDETVRGIGTTGRSPPCGEGRLKAGYPDWAKSTNVFSARARGGNRTGFEAGLLVFAHEITHFWTAYASYDRNGEREPLFGNYCRCHWRPELHTPAAFPWDPTSAGPGGFMSDYIDGRPGGFWRENADGTFTLITDYWGGGHSWLDLYLMGLADPDEVPDTFILRNLQPVPGTDQYTGEREIVKIEQVIAAEGPRDPPASRSQKVFNVGFVYVTAPGQTPDPDSLGLQRELRDKVVEHWSHITGGRSHITTHVNRMVDATLENPAPGSFQSGLGVISGWACEAEEIVIELAGTPVPAAYGTPRADTQARCGDSNNGFGLLVNWNNLGNGEHTIRALVDGVEFARTTVQVTTFGVEVLRGVSSTFPLPDFPAAGETTTVQWQESQQNFVITAGQPGRGGGYNRVADVPAVLEIPPLGSSQSGIGLISGWACEAEEIVIELAGTPVPAAYGTSRADTQMRCGDTNNGFGLLVNWNNLGNGEHPVRALADGVEFANTTVQVTTFGVEFLRGVSGTFTLSDFPRSGAETRIRWEESLQNFVIIP